MWQAVHGEFLCEVPLTCPGQDLGFWGRHHGVLWLLQPGTSQTFAGWERHCWIYWDTQGQAGAQGAQQPLGMLEWGSAFPPQLPQHGASWLQASNALLCGSAVIRNNPAGFLGAAPTLQDWWVWEKGSAWSRSKNSMAGHDLALFQHCEELWRNFK